jgi:hypothetical protein
MPAYRAEVRKQINVRLDEETEERIARLTPIVKEALGINVTMSDLIRLAVRALAREYAKKGGRP